MTAPGDLVLIILLVALFVASCGYAAGRMHQRYQLKQDREAAYRDGYETASSRVFSLAARLASPRRPARGAAAVKPARAQPSPVPPTNAPPASGLPGPVAAVPAALPGSAPPGNAPPASGLPSPTAPTLTRHGSTPPDTALPGAALTGAAPPGSGLPGSGLPGAGENADFATASGVGAGTAPAWPVAGSTVAGDAHPAALREHPTRLADPGRAVRHQGVPRAVADLVIPRRRRAVREAPEEEGAFGFPAPPPPPRHTVAEPAAVGGVHYQPFRDPRPADGSGPVLGRRETPADPPPATGGKHTVPDELVQAATYRLPADRIFRAKVPNSTPLIEQTTHVSVPKPRRRADENVVPPP